MFDQAGGKCQTDLNVVKENGGVKTAQRVNRFMAAGALDNSDRAPSR